MIDPSSEDLDFVLGPGPGTTPEERALHSKREYVRSMDQLAEANDLAKGRKLSAAEALAAYGWDVLDEVASEGAALLSAGPKAVGRLLKRQRDTLGLDLKQVSTTANIDIHIVESAETFKRLPIRDIERIARSLGLDERFVSWHTEPHLHDQQIGVRLRTIGEEHPRMTAHAVAAIAEATWVASTQLRLQKELGLSRPETGIEVSDNYGGPGYPAYEHGYYLATEARQKLALGDGPLHIPLRELIEDRLNIPVIQTEIGPSIAGVTVEMGDRRAIVTNLDGENRRVLVRRSTFAHEFGHLLYDPPHRLKSLHVDDYDELELPAYKRTDPIERRTNAFAVEFIAPGAAVLDCYQSATRDGVWEVMNTFGLSYTAARYHIWNSAQRQIPLEDLQLTPGRELDPKWEAGESYTLDFHPLPRVRPSRAGRFSAIVVRAADERIISWDTAAEMLEVASEELRCAVPAIQSLFPTVFS
jgi:Zn-dependent peptidase ImmA (M78 family)